MSPAASPADPALVGEALDQQVAALAAAVRRLEARVETLEGREAPVPGAPSHGGGSAAAAPAEGTLPLPEVGLLPALLGKAFLILGGAFLFRALADAERIPRGFGSLLGLAYAGLWTFRAWRSRTRAEGHLFLISAALIAYPLLWEASTRYRVFPPEAAALLLVVVSAALVGVAWLQDLEGPAWMATLGSALGGFALAITTRGLEAFALALLVLGGASLWLTYGRRWHGLRWPLALSANAVVAVLGLLASRPGGPPEAYRELSAGRAMALCLGLVAVYLGSFGARMVQRYRPVNPFEVVQTLGVLLIGYGGAVRIAQQTQAGLGILGGSLLLGGAACYSVAFAFVEDRERVQGNFLFFTTLALVFALSGSFLVLGGSALPAAFAVVGVAFAFLGTHYGRTTLLFHGAAFLLTAALASGLPAQAQAAFLGPGPVPAPDGLLLLVTAALGSAHLLMVLRRSGEPGAWSARLPSLVCGLLGLLGLGCAALWAGTRALGAGQEPALLALLRTAVLSASAVGLALVGRFLATSECAWLVYPVLGMAALKLLLEDLSAGRPLTLFLAFSFYGAALLAAPKLLRKVQTLSES